MKRALIIGLTGCAFALAPIIAASAMPVATPSALGRTDEVVIQVKGGHGHGHGHGHGWPSPRSRAPHRSVPRPPRRLAPSSPWVVTLTAATASLLEHDPEKCVAVFRRDHAQ